MNKAHFQETSSARNNGPSPSPGFINFSYCGKRVNFSRVSKSQKESCPIPMIVQWREDSKIIEASAENDFRFQRLLGMVCTTEVKQNHLYILLVFPDLYVLVCVQCNERKAVALAH